MDKQLISRIYNKLKYLDSKISNNPINKWTNKSNISQNKKKRQWLINI
jgi:hypothetical protein